MENNQSGEVQVFGNTATVEQATEQAETQTQATPEQSQETITYPNTKAPKETETQVVEEEVVVEQVAETKAEPKKEEVKAPKKDFEVSFNKEPKQKTETQKETQTVTEDVVLKFLNEQGIKASTLQDIQTKEELSDPVKQFKKFHEETNGRGIEDFYNSQKDWAKEPKDKTLAAYYKFKNPNMSDEDIADTIDLKTVTEEDEDTLSERELKSRKIEYNRTYAEALAFMQDKAKDFKTSLKSVEPQQRQLTPEEIEKYYQPYWAKRDKSLKELNEIGISLGKIGDINLNITPKQKELVSKYTQTQEAFFERWKDKDGGINPDTSNLDTLWSIPEARQELIADMLDQAHTLFMEDFSKTNRNVDLGDIKKQEQQANGKTRMLVFGEDESSSSFGKPILKR